MECHTVNNKMGIRLNKIFYGKIKYIYVTIKINIDHDMKLSTTKCVKKPGVSYVFVYLCVVKHHDQKLFAVAMSAASKIVART